MKKHKLTDRGKKRAAARKAVDLVKDKARLALLQPGGSPERPISVEAPPLVDLRATSTPCPLCEGELALDEHAVVEHEGRSLRVARVTCRRCHVKRELFFVLAPRLAN